MQVKYDEKKKKIKNFKRSYTPRPKLQPVITNFFILVTRFFKSEFFI